MYTASFVGARSLLSSAFVPPEGPWEHHWAVIVAGVAAQRPKISNAAAHRDIRCARRRRRPCTQVERLRQLPPPGRRLPRLPDRQAQGHPRESKSFCSCTTTSRALHGEPDSRQGLQPARRQGRLSWLQGVVHRQGRVGWRSSWPRFNWRQKGRRRAPCSGPRSATTSSSTTRTTGRLVSSRCPKIKNRSMRKT